MANNYNQATVQPSFPISAVSELEKELLSYLGFSHEIWKSDSGNTIYFFSSDYRRDEYEEIDVDMIAKYAAQGDAIAIDVQNFISQNGSDEAELIDYVSSNFSWDSLFQHILKKPECHDIEDVCVMGAFTCDKLRPGEFGGWVTRITRDSVQHDGTHTAFERMQQEDSFLPALDIVYQLATANCLDVDNDPNDPHTEQEIADECRRQRSALNLIHDYLTNHPLVR